MMLEKNSIQKSPCNVNYFFKTQKIEGMKKGIFLNIEHYIMIIYYYNICEGEIVP